MKTAILVHSDPKGGEEAAGRVFNALAVAHDLKRNGDEVRVLFLGTGTRWIAELTRPDNPMHGLFDLVQDRVDGVSRGCAQAFDAIDEVETSEFAMLDDNPIPGTAGLPSISRLLKDGFSVMVY